MKNKIIILLSLLLLTGCTVNYNLEINKDTLNETITGTVTKEESSQDSNATGLSTIYSIINEEQKPIYNKESKVLMLGTMPSPKSREVGFYYGHPRNRFWKVLSDVCGEEVPETKKDKITFALRNHIAVWDVLAGCEIRGADDSSIRFPKSNVMNLILKEAAIQAIFASGQIAAQLYRRYCYKDTGIEIICLPSTSPANCRVSYEELYEAYSVIQEYIR